MNHGTADILSLIAARLNVVREELQARVAEYGEAQGREIVALKNSLDLATVAAQDLQSQLDAAMKRIAELESQQPAEPEPPVEPAKPTLKVTPDATGLRVAWTNARRLHIVPTKGRHLPAYTVDVAAAVGDDVVAWESLRSKWDGFGEGWELSAWASIGNIASDEAHVVVPKASQPVEPLPPTHSHVPPIPANAVHATSVAHAVQLRDESRRSGQPFVVRGLTIDSAQLPDRQLSLDGCKGPVWILDNDWRGDSKGFAAHQSPLFWDNERQIYIVGNVFRDMPKTCVIYSYGPADCVIAGNRFENVRQAIHLQLRENKNANLLIAKNIGTGISKIAVEIQSHGFSQSNKFETLGVRLIGNDMRCTVGGEMVYSLACPSTRDMLVQGNIAWQPVKGSPEDANPKHGGIGYSFEMMAGVLDANTAINSRIGYCLEGKMAPWGVVVKANNVYEGPGKRVGYQNDGDKNPHHVIE